MMMKKQLLSALIALTFLISAVPNVSAAVTDAAKYTYQVYPILEGFNEWYFVKTDNPDPKTFRFIDKDTVYMDSGQCELTRCTYSFADIVYENADTLRVDGGYIFNGSSSDGGILTLKVNNNPNSYYSQWQETDITVQVPKAVDYIDYLVNTYATEEAFFDNLTAVQAGLRSISRYSGSFIRGKISRTPDEYWGIQAYNHVDQSFYIVSPFERSDNEYLFASWIYPFVCDSLGFPSIIARVAQRLEPSSTYQWNSYNHSLVNITYNGETKSYGGQGTGEGQGITKDKIRHYYSFGSADDTVALADARQLLVDYSDIIMDDDIPRDEQLTWKQVTDNAGSGGWAKVSGGDYSYLYRQNDNDSYYCDEFGEGHSVYWSGSLGYASDTWVDGRYVSNGEIYVPGEALEDHPESDVIIYNALVPVLDYERSWKYNYSTQQYEIIYSNISITYECKTTKFYYDSENKYWKPNINQIYELEQFIEDGLVDSSCLDSICFTYEDLKAMKVDGNTNAAPGYGHNYDCTVVPGTQFGTFSGATAEISGDFLLVHKKGGTQILRLSALNKAMIDALSDDTVTLICYINSTLHDNGSDCFELNEAQMTAIEYILAADIN